MIKCIRELIPMFLWIWRSLERKKNRQSANSCRESRWG